MEELCDALEIGKGNIYEYLEVYYTPVFRRQLSQWSIFKFVLAMHVSWVGVSFYKNSLSPFGV